MIHSNKKSDSDLKSILTMEDDLDEGKFLSSQDKDSNVVDRVSQDKDIESDEALEGFAKSNLLSARPIYKPFKYDWAYEAWLTQQRVHWLPEEVNMADDVQDWKNKITVSEKNLLTHIFRLFTQMDVEVHHCYMEHYSGVFKPIEVQMMLSAFANIETIHMAAYAHLLDTVGMPEVEYSAFMKYKEMKDKYDYLRDFELESKDDVDLSKLALILAVFGAFTEGLQLFASFAILLNFPRHGKMKGMGQIITWSVRDETLHTISIIKLFRTFIHENPAVLNKELKNQINEACLNVVLHEDAFINLAFEMGDLEGLRASDLKLYIRYIADKRLVQLGLNPIFLIEDNPLPWLDEILNGVEHANFFESRVTEYSKATTTGSWSSVFSNMDHK